jgi:RNA polymerase sigma-70 factor (ECF subfamily)
MLRRGDLRRLWVPVGSFSQAVTGVTAGVTVSEPQQADPEQLWPAFGERLRAFIRRRVESDADADDILQEVFLRIHKHADTVERQERLVSWLFQVTRNAIADYYRAPVRRRELPSGAPSDLEETEVRAWDSVEDGDGESLEARRELAACLRPMIDQLPPRYRAAVTLVDLEGVPQKEAAARAGVSLSGMKSRVQRGRHALEHLLHDCCRIDLDAGGRITDYQPWGDGCSPCATAGCDRDGDRTPAGAP